MKVHPIDHSSPRVESVSNISTPTPGTNNPRTELGILSECLLTLVLFFSLAWTGYIVFAMFTTVNNPEITIDSLKVSNFNLSSHPNHISADWNVQMCLETMDSHGYLKFSDITVFVYYNHEILGVTNLMPFDASPQILRKHFGGEFWGSSGYVDDSIFNKVSQGINAGSLKFDMKFSVWVKKTYIEGWVNRSDEGYFVIKCNNVELVFGYSDVSKAQMLNDSHKCSFSRGILEPASHAIFSRKQK